MPLSTHGLRPIQEVSRALRGAETALAAALVAAIFVVLLANVVSRGLGHPLVWTDELAVHLMVWIAFLGASLGIASRSHMAIGILPERLGDRARAWLVAIVDALVLGFMAMMAVLVWNWLDLPGLIAAGSGAALAERSFNFVYLDPTLTLGVRKIWFWLILPLTCVTGTIHAAATLAQSIGALK
ncbi:TRAP transporter small permease [Falsirhodobacter xinxiangensis]|uniref:TRAP transporter small permease n=1 Tax=Falsirhodobacter xinxiangensis TaxID=2530049 RepID=UPI00145A6F6D|nr:TRAP transporter small permease subunit [Rhodobacter xinxiangensis]